MGIGNTTAAAAICASTFGGPVGGWVGRGTGIEDETLARKIGVVERAVDRIRPGTDPIEVLRQVGGAELAAIAGGIVEARRRSIPVLLDGFVVSAAASVLEVARPGALDHCLASHRSDETGHGRLLERLGKLPLLELRLRLGEGSGALAALPLVRLAAAGVTEVATFAERGLGR
jgi:nicotinate-nucleotide--dimethylbenzimidazole phosphoribosyltransferase